MRRHLFSFHVSERSSQEIQLRFSRFEHVCHPQYKQTWENTYEGAARLVTMSPPDVLSISKASICAFSFHRAVAVPTGQILSQLAAGQWGRGEEGAGG